MIKKPAGALKPRQPKIGESMTDGLLPVVSIVIPVFNEERYLGSCLTSLMSLSYPKDRHEILLVDNGSTDRTLEIAEEFSEIFIYVKKNVKVGAVRNYGVQKAKGSVIVFLDSDCVVGPDWLINGIRKLAATPNSVIGGQYLLRENPSWLEKNWILESSDRTVFLTTLVGGCIFIPENIFHQVGGFDEQLNAGEDSDLTERLTKAKFSVKIDPSLSVIHLGFPSRIRPFVMRQMWHSSDYINGLPYSLQDKIFLLTLGFMVGLAGMLISLTFLSKDQVSLMVFTSLIVLSPAVLSIKRITRSGTKYKSIKDYISIYFVDVLYLFGRTMGVISGIKNRLVLRPEAKVERR
ncbi:MAG: glycosyltransferase involved in cell wall biosynthesis [Oleiphilaceae bacterium]